MVLSASAQVPSYVPTDSLVGYWGFNGNVNDESGNGNDGTNNGATLTTDRFGNINSAYSFSNNYISVNHNTSLGFTQNSAFAISFWVNKIDTQTSMHLMGKRANNTGNFNWQIADINGGVGLLFKSSDASNVNCGVDTNHTLITESWIHIVAQYDNGFWSLFANGNLLKSIYLTCFNADYNTELKFGVSGNYVPFYGDLDDIGIWNRALDSTEIQNLYSGSACTYYDTVTVYDTVSISVTDTLIIDVVITQLMAPNNTNTIKVYPNPTNDIIYIDNGDYSMMNGYTITILNSGGQPVFNSLINAPTFTVNISQFAMGTYYLQILDNNSNIVEVRHIVLQ